MKEGLLFGLSRRVSRKSLRILAYHGLWTTPGYQYGNHLFMRPEQFDVLLLPNLYGDISALNLPNRCRRRFRDCLRPGVMERVVHGSDVPVPIFASAPFMHGLIGVRDYLRLRRIKNPIERDYQIKRAIGFPEETFTRAASILRITHHESPNRVSSAVLRA